MNKPPFVLTLATLLTLLSAPSLRAVTFRATLNSVKLDARPGQVLTSSFRLTLDEGQPATRFKAHIEDWWRSEDGTRSFYAPPGSHPRSCGQWVSVNPVEAVAKPGEPLVVRLTIAVPREVASGGFWCVLTVDEVPDPLAKKTDGVDVKFLASVSTGVFVYLSPLNRSASITDVEVSSDAVGVTLRNDGNTPVAIEGRFEFLAPGATAPTAVVQLQRGTLLTAPAPVSRFSAKLPDAPVLPSGHYTVKAIIDFGVDHYIGAQRELDVKREPAVRVGPE